MILVAAAAGPEEWTGQRSALAAGHGQQQQRQLLRPVEYDHAQVAGIIGASRVVSGLV
jgi:hypothetical protein